MKARRCILIGVLALVFLTGCIDSTTVVAVKKDGSGIVMETVFINPALSMMADQMMGGFAKSLGDSSETPGSTVLEIAKYKSKALKMGEGVRYVSAKEQTRKDGTKGVQVVYEFDDIRNLKVESDPDTPDAEGMSEMMRERSKKEDDDDPITFNFTQGRTSRLTINLPKSEKKEIEKTEQPKKKENASGKMAQMAMFKQFFQGFRVRVMIKIVDGEIIRTNAYHVEKIKDNPYVTLFDLDFGKILSMAEKDGNIAMLEEIQDIDAARKFLKNIPGIKIEPSDRVEIEFR